MALVWGTCTLYALTFWVQKIAVGGSNTTTSARMRCHLTKSGWEFVKIFFSEVKYGKRCGVLIFCVWVGKKWSKWGNWDVKSV